MSNAEDYPNAIEVIAEKLYKKLSYTSKKQFNLVTNYRPYDLLDYDDQQCYRDLAISFLDAVSYFDNISCNQCGNHNPKECACFVTCEDFVPKGLVKEGE